MPTKKPGPIRSILKGFFRMPRTVGEDIVATTTDAIMWFPRAVISAAKEERIALQTYTARERAISEQVLLWWWSLVGIACLTFFLIGGWGNLLTVAIGLVWVCARFGWWDPIRDIVTKRVLAHEKTGDLEAKALNPYDSQILQQEISGRNCEVALGILKEWNKLPKTERGPKSLETIVRLIDTLTHGAENGVLDREASRETSGAILGA